MTRISKLRGWVACGLLFGAGSSLLALEHVTLRNGFELDCERREVVGERVRLYLMAQAGADPDSANYLEVAADAVARVEAMAAVPEKTVAVETRIVSLVQDQSQNENKEQGGRGKKRGGADGTKDTHMAVPAPSAAEMKEMLARAGVQHRVDEDLLASVVRAESAGKVAVVSRVGALGLMQLMPATATAMGVRDAFVAEQNIDGGSAYLDWLLTRYHDNMALALAAYNAGPGAVDRYHGVPPFLETRAYVARVIREFNRRKLAAR